MSGNTGSRDPRSTGLGMAGLAALALVAVTAGVAVGSGSDAPLPPPPDFSLPAGVPTRDSARLDDLTWVEARDRIAAGATTVILPTGGTEQNGPHMALGKHNRIVAEVAERAAEEAGDTLVAPVLAYVPEGDPARGTGHTRFPGTISVRPEVFVEVLTDAATSLRAAGFTTIALLGDSAWNQDPQDEVADTLSRRWAGEGVRVVNLRDAYDPETNGEHALLRARGLSEAEIGTHAGPRDTAELLAVDPSGLRPDLMAPDGGGDPFDTGVDGDPTGADAELGDQLIDLKVEAVVAGLHRARGG